MHCERMQCGRCVDWLLRSSLLVICNLPYLFAHPSVQHQSIACLRACARCVHQRFSLSHVKQLLHHNSHACWLDVRSCGTVRHQHCVVGIAAARLAAAVAAFAVAVPVVQLLRRGLHHSHQLSTPRPRRLLRERRNVRLVPVANSLWWRRRQRRDPAHASRLAACPRTSLPHM